VISVRSVGTRVATAQGERQSIAVIYGKHTKIKSAACPQTSHIQIQPAGCPVLCYDMRVTTNCNHATTDSRREKAEWALAQ